MGDENLLDALRGLPGRPAVRGPDDADYDRGRRVWNGCIDKFPAALVRPSSATQVAAVVRVVADRGVPLAVRGGGHGLPGFATCEGGVVLDLGALADVEVDAATRRARLGGGATWRDYDLATAKHGLASTGGLISTTGVGGLTLGGGIGWLTRAHGLACDNLLAAEIVAADGRVVRASANENSELFWGLRGGGGNFGVVTAFEFRLHPVQEVQGGMVLFPLSRLQEVAAAYAQWAPGLADDFTTVLSVFTAPNVPEMPEDLRGLGCVGLVGCHLGGEAAANADLAAIRALGPSAEEFGPMPYTDLQSMIDADWPAGDRYFFTGAFSDGLSPGLLGALGAALAERPGPRCGVDIHHMEGAAARVPEQESAYAGRAYRYTLNIIAGWEDEAHDSAFMAWARQTRSALAPFCAEQGYVNFATDPQEGAELTATYGRQRYQRLRTLKQQWDPTNVFALNQNIVP